MATLIVSLGNTVLKETLLRKERIIIGRHLKNDLIIDNLVINGEHGVIVTANNEYFLEDLNSTNGTGERPAGKDAFFAGWGCDQVGEVRDQIFRRY